MVLIPQDTRLQIMPCTMFGGSSAVPGRSVVSANNLDRDLKGNGKLEQRQGVCVSCLENVVVQGLKTRLSGEPGYKQGHQFHQDSLTKEEWILELSPGNAGPSSEASLCKYYTLVSFHQYEYVTVCRWIAGFKTWDRPRATGYQPTEFKGSLPKRCWCLGLGQNALSCPNANSQNAIGARPSAFGGVPNPRTGHHKSVNPFEVTSSERDL